MFRQNFFVIYRVLFIVLISVSASFGQNAKIATKYYNQGALAFEKGNYKLADSLYTLSLDSHPYSDAYFNRAVCRQKLGDVKGFCYDLFACSKAGDKEAKELFWKRCGNQDTIYHEFHGNLDSDSVTLAQKEIIESSQYIDHYFYYKYNFKEELIISYFIKNGDTIFLGGLELFPPEFPGGESGVLKYFSDNLRISKRAMEYYISGTIYISLLMDKEGKIVNINLLRGLNEELNEEVMDLISKMPAWKPSLYKSRSQFCQVVWPIIMPDISKEVDRY